MDGASFWSALTKPSVFSYAAKPSYSSHCSHLGFICGARLRVARCGSAEVYVCNIILNPRPEFTGTRVCANCQDARKLLFFFFFAFHAELLVFLAAAAMFPACPTQV